MRRFTRILLAAPLALGLAHCAVEDSGELLEQPPAAQQGAIDAGAPLDATTGAPTSATDAGTTLPFAITSSVVKDGEYIDPKYRCNVPSPALSWTAGPAGTRSYALIFKDQGNGFFHWTIFDIPASERGLPSGVPNVATLTAPSGAKQAPNWSRRAGYGGPCGEDSTYVFKLYALDVASLPGVTTSSSGAQIERVVQEHDLASATLSIRSKRPPR